MHWLRESAFQFGGYSCKSAMRVTWTAYEEKWCWQRVLKTPSSAKMCNRPSELCRSPSERVNKSKCNIARKTEFYLFSGNFCTSNPEQNGKELRTPQFFSGEADRRSRLLSSAGERMSSRQAQRTPLVSARLTKRIDAREASGYMRCVCFQQSIDTLTNTPLSSKFKEEKKFFFRFYSDDLIRLFVEFCVNHAFYFRMYKDNAFDMVQAVWDPTFVNWS